jgi:hypothetical protein
MAPVEITSPDVLQERTQKGGVLAVTRGPFAISIAHPPE